MIQSPQSVFALGVPALEIPFYSNLGRLVIHEDDQGQVLATDGSFQSFVTPHQRDFAKMGVFLHAYADRVSHHMCTDRSWFQREISGDYISHYDQVYCAQGSHFLWHAWEQGTSQDSHNLESEFQTMRPALEGTWAQLLEFAQLRNPLLRTGFNETELIDQLIGVLSISDPTRRRGAMVVLLESYSALPLPGHGNVANLTIDEWLDLAGAPTLNQPLDQPESVPAPAPIFGAWATFWWSRGLRRRIKASQPAPRG